MGLVVVGIRREPAPIEPFLPLMLFAIVFGLSMDYEVFLLSRVKKSLIALATRRTLWPMGLRQPPESFPPRLRCGGRVRSVFA